MMTPQVKAIAVIVATVLLYGGGYWNGSNNANTEWRLKWSERDRADDKAAKAKEAENRAEEARRVNEQQRIAADAQNQIDRANSERDRAKSSSLSLQQQIDITASKLAASRAAVNSTTANAGKARASYARVLADMSKQLDQRAGALAEAADRSRIAGLTCEKAYDSLTKEKAR